MASPVPKHDVRHGACRLTAQEAEMTWTGMWRNQYGSSLEIESEADRRIEGSFRTALEDSAFRGQSIAISGRHQGDCISFAGGGATPGGDVLVSYTGLLRDGRMETLWYVVTDSVPAGGAPATLEKVKWWRAMMTGADTFERVS
jgi:hypothetical protein